MDTVVKDSGRLRVYLSLKPISYTVVFDANHDIVDGQMAEQNFQYDSPQALTSVGFSVYAMRFVGWARTQNGEKAFDNAAEVVNLSATDKETVVLYALWEREDAQSVIIKYINGSTIKQTTLARGSNFVVETPEMDDGLALDGWYTSDGDFFDAQSVVNTDLTLYPKFYMEGLTFDGNKVVGFDGDAVEVVIPTVFHGVAITEIAAQAFEGADFEECEIPNSITTIGERAFKDCFNLISLDVPQSVKTIGKGAFEMTASRSVDSDGKIVYSNKNSLLAFVTLPFVGGGAADNAFLAYVFGASSAQDNFVDAEGRTISSETVFRYSYLPDSLKSVFVNGNGAVGDYAFYCCSTILYAEFDVSLTSVGDYAFYGCDQMEIVGLGLLKEIGDYAFFGNEKNSDIQFGAIENIGDYAFCNNKSLNTLTFPEGLKSIGERAFYNCVAFQSLTLPQSMVSIGLGAFGSDLSFGALSNGNYIAFQLSSAINSVSLPFIGGGTPETAYFSYIFGAESFDDNWINSSGSDVEINGQTASVIILNYLPYALNDVTISGAAVEVPNNAFYYCVYLTEINFTAHIQTVGESAFEGCFNAAYTGLDSVVELKARAFCNAAFFEGCDMPLLETIGDFAFAFTGITSFTFSANLKSIGEAAFAMTEIKEVVFPEGLLSIGGMAFYACNSLTSATFLSKTPCEAGSNIFTVRGNDGLDYVSALAIWVPVSEADVVPYRLYRERLGFRDYASSIFPINYASSSGYILENNVLLGYIQPSEATEVLTVVDMPAGTVELADFAFYNNTNITKIVMPEGFKKIGKYAFYNCTSIARLSMPSTLLEIDEFAFAGFFVGNNITRLYFPEGFKRLGAGAFLTCFNLKIVRLPASLEYIGYLAFGAASNIERIYFNGDTPPEVGSNTDSSGNVVKEIFAYVNVAKTIMYVPFGYYQTGSNQGKSFVEVYRSTEGFSQFASYLKAMPEGPEVGHYGDGAVFVDLDGCDSVLLSFANGTSEYGTYRINGAVLEMVFKTYGTIQGTYTASSRTITFTLNDVQHTLQEPRYFYDSYNWTNFNLYPNGKGMFDMAGFYLTPFDWTITGNVFTITINGNNVSEENAQYAGVKTYTGSFDSAMNMITVGFMLNDYWMDFSCLEISKQVGLGEMEKVYGTYKLYSTDNPDYVIVTIVFYGNGVCDIYIGSSPYLNLSYTIEGNIVSINFMTRWVDFTLDKDGDLHGDIGIGRVGIYVYEDELHDNTFGDEEEETA